MGHGSGRGKSATARGSLGGGSAAGRRGEERKRPRGGCYCCSSSGKGLAPAEPPQPTRLVVIVGATGTGRGGGAGAMVLREYFASTSPAERASHAAGLGKAIGVPELGDHFAGRKSLAAAIDEIKANTRVLAVAQVHKIRRMADTWGWPVRRLDATPTVRACLAGAGRAAEAAAWERNVFGPGLAA